MTRSRYVSFGLLCVWLIQAIAGSAQTRVPPGSAQTRVTLLPSQTLDFMSLDAATSTIVTGQPYSADGVTKITQTHGRALEFLLGKRRIRERFHGQRHVRPAAFQNNITAILDAADHLHCRVGEDLPQPLCLRKCVGFGHVTRALISRGSGVVQDRAIRAERFTLEDLPRQPREVAADERRILVQDGRVH